MQDKASILVPWDFSKLSEAALIQSIKMSDVFDYNITLLHIENDNKKKLEAKSKLKEVVNNTYIHHGIRPAILVKSGNVYSAIGETAVKSKYKMIVMQTSGVRGLQKVFCSNAMKIISKTDHTVPFVVVQEKPSHTKSFNNILVPIDNTFETRQKLKWLKLISNNYRITAQIVSPNFSDKKHRTTVKNNVKQTIAFLKENDIKYEIITGADKGNFAKAINEIAHKTESDLILIMATMNTDFTSYMFGVPEQKIIANKYKIPVMCINPKNTRKVFNYG